MICELCDKIFITDDCLCKKCIEGEPCDDIVKLCPECFNLITNSKFVEEGPDE